MRQPVPEHAWPRAAGVGAAERMWYETCGETWQGKSEGLLQRVPCVLRSRVEYGTYRRETPSWGDVVVPERAALDGLGAGR